MPRIIGTQKRHKMSFFIGFDFLVFEKNRKGVRVKVRKNGSSVKLDARQIFILFLFLPHRQIENIDEICPPSVYFGIYVK